MFLISNRKVFLDYIYISNILKYTKRKIIFEIMPKRCYHCHMRIDYKAIGKNIHDIRSARGMTQAELAEIVDLSTPYMSYIESGSKHLGLETLIKIANALGTTTDVLLLGNQPRDKLTYQREAREIFEDCNDKERNFILYIVQAVKNGFKLLK